MAAPNIPMMEESTGRGLVIAFPTDEVVDRMWHFAERMAPAKFIPDTIRGDVASVFYLISTAQEMGLRWTHALRGMYLDDKSKLAMEGNIMLALLQSHGFDVKLLELRDPVGFTCTITRPGASEPVSRSFTLYDAARIRIYYDAETKEWRTLADTMRYRNYGLDMCQWRSLARAARVAAADLMGGVYLPEELSEVAQQNGQDATIGDPEKTAEGASPEDPFAVGEKTEAPVAETQAAVAETPLPSADEIRNVKAESKPNGKAAAPVIEMPSQAAAPLPAPVKDPAPAPLKAPAPAPKETPPPPPAPQPSPVAAPVAAQDPETIPTEFDIKIDAIATLLGGDKKVAHKLIARYFAGALNIKPVNNKLTIPKDRSKLLPALILLHENLDDAMVQDLRTDPEGVGVKLAGSLKPTKLDQEFELLNWPSSLRDLSRKVMAFAGQDESQFMAWIHSAVAGDGLTIASLEPLAIDTLLKLYMLVKGRAFEIVDWAVDHGKSVNQSLQEMVEASKVPIDRWDAPFAGRILDAVRQASEAKQSAPQPPPGDEEDFMSGGLPFGN